jgi:Zn-dependent protease
MPVNLIDAVLKVLLLWILTTPHEFAHAWVATRLGDDTPRHDGRLTLNPLAHIDWVGTTLLPFIMVLMGLGFIGWGKPVRSEPSKLRGGMNGLLLVALAGPASNIVMAIVLGALASAFQGNVFAHYLAYGVDLSLFLAVFNLLPIPPLDGSKLLLALRIPIKFYIELARFGFVILLLVMTRTAIGQWMNEWSASRAYTILAVFGWRG